MIVTRSEYEKDKEDLRKVLDHLLKVTEEQRVQIADLQERTPKHKP